jgi:hypothetical protein
MGARQQPSQGETCTWALLTAAAELEQVQLHDALEILILMAAENDPRFDRAAARWVGRLVAETPIGLADGRYAIALVERLPQCLRRCGASHVGASNDQRPRRGGRAALIIAGLARDLSPARRCAERGAAAFVEDVLGAASKPVRRRCAVRRRAGRGQLNPPAMAPPGRAAGRARHPVHRPLRSRSAKAESPALQKEGPSVAPLGPARGGGQPPAGPCALLHELPPPVQRAAARRVGSNRLANTVSWRVATNEPRSRMGLPDKVSPAVDRTTPLGARPKVHRFASRHADS